MKFFKWVFYTFLFLMGSLLVLAFILGESESRMNSENQSEDKIEDVSPPVNQSNQIQYSSPTQVGYFKADNNNRVFTYNIDRRMPESDIKTHADRRMHTSGRITYVFYYYRNAPNPTTASSLDRALQITENSDFRYSFMKMGNGQSNFSSHR